MTTGFLSVFVTAAGRAEAEKIARAVVGENLAACANILPGIHSVYHWQGKIEESEECALILKCRAEGFAALETRIRALHSYECPCIVAWPIAAGNRAYLDWVAAHSS